MNSVIKPRRYIQIEALTKSISMRAKFFYLIIIISLAMVTHSDVDGEYYVGKDEICNYLRGRGVFNPTPVLYAKLISFFDMPLVDTFEPLSPWQQTASGCYCRLSSNNGPDRRFL